MHGALLPAGPAAAAAPCHRSPRDGSGATEPRPRHVTVLRAGKEGAGPKPGGAEGRRAQNGLHKAAGTTTSPSQRESCEQDGGGSAEVTARTGSSPGASGAGGAPGEKCSRQAEAVTVNAASRDGDRPQDPQTSKTSAQHPPEDVSSQADQAGVGEGGTVDGDGTGLATPPRTESSGGADGTPENLSLEVSNGPEPLPEARASPKGAEVEKEEGEMSGDPQSMHLCCHPSQIVLFSEAGFAGHRREIWGDVPDATSWELSHTISIRVIRGGWVMYEKPRFHGRKCVLAEGDVEIDNPWTAYGQSKEPRGSRPFRIGSFKRVVRVSARPLPSAPRKWGALGVPLTGRPRAFGCFFPRWLVYSKPFFDDDPYVLEPGGYPSLKAWGAKDPSICSMHPIRLVSGCPVVERPGEPQVVIYEDNLPGLALWVGYEKEGFRGHQYLLEEGEYHDWRQWGGYNKELVSLRLIRTVRAPRGDGATRPVLEALPDTQLAGYGTVTQSIHVLSGVWVAYEGPNFSGEQYILEKGVYRNCEDWGAADCCIASAQPILPFVPPPQILLFSEPDFLGEHLAFEDEQGALPDGFVPRSCRVRGGSWILFDGQDFSGEQHVLSEGEYPTLGAMGCLSSATIRSLKKVPFFSEPSIFLHGLECFEGKEIELNSEVRSLQAEGFNNHVLSVRVKGGIWVLCEHGDFRGRQWLLDCTEITNWLTYSGLQHVGSLYPIRQRRVYFRIRSKELELYLSVPDDVEDMKAGRVVVSSLSEQSSSVWYYEDGLLKNQVRVAPNMSLQVIGPAGKGSKAVLWSETRMPRQTWSIDAWGRIRSQMFEDMILDIKGGRSYDRDHAIIWDAAEERPTQIWDVQVL
uniref:Crystallin beta-gamma domain containing 2 n=1 Tax=Anser brachyrhynchus TaxID=132585 RepID=A0A8B9B9S3_9AVES